MADDKQPSANAAAEHGAPGSASLAYRPISRHRNGVSWAKRKIVPKPALPAIAAGLLAALAIVAGGTAPLPFTAGWGESNPTPWLSHSQAVYLAHPIWTFFGQPSRSAGYLPGGAALLLAFALLIIIAGRFTVTLSGRHAR
jgi:ABC-type phosphate transport system permease subunit